MGVGRDFMAVGLGVAPPKGYGRLSPGNLSS
jgi:hypothetical protein